MIHRRRRRLLLLQLGTERLAVPRLEGGLEAALRADGWAAADSEGRLAPALRLTAHELEVARLADGLLTCDEEGQKEMQKKRKNIINLKYIVASSLIALSSASQMHPSSHPEKYLLFCHPIPKIFLPYFQNKFVIT